MQNDSENQDAKSKLEILELKLKSSIPAQVDARVSEINKFYFTNFGILVRIVGYGVTIATAIVSLVVSLIISYYGLDQKSEVDKRIDQAIKEQDIPKLIEDRVTQEIKRAFEETSIRKRASLLAEELVRNTVSSELVDLKQNLKNALDSNIRDGKETIDKNIASAIESYSQRLSAEEGKLAELLNTEPGRDVADLIVYLQKALSVDVEDVQEFKQAFQAALRDYQTKLDQQDAFYVYLGLRDNRQWSDEAFSIDGSKILPTPSEIGVGQRLTALRPLNARRNRPEKKGGRIILGDQIGLLKSGDVVSLVEAPIKIDINKREYFAIKVRKAR